MNSIGGTLVTIFADAERQSALVDPAASAGLTLLPGNPGSLPALDANATLVVALDHQFVTESCPLSRWKETIVAAHGASHSALVVITDNLGACLGDDPVAHADDCAVISSPTDLERALSRCLKLARERMFRVTEAPEARIRLREIVTEGISDVFFQLRNDLRINYVNRVWNLQLGYPATEALGRSFLEYISPEHRPEIERALQQLVSGEQLRLTTEAPFLSQEGHTVWMEIRAVKDPNALGAASVTGLLLDISSRRESEAELRASHEHYRQMALRDSLTGLSNRLVFADRLQHALAVGSRRGSGVALLFTDLDGFKAVNDTYGHAIGDQVLVDVAARLNEQIRAGDTIARYGGDEFAVILEDLSDATQALQIADRLIDALREPLVIGVTRISIGMSIGITLLSGRSVTPEEAIAEADIALYQAKDAGRHQYRLFEPLNDPGKESLYRFDLSRGIESQQLNILYLPIVNLETDQVSSLEARIRWDHPSWGRLAPGQFLRRADASEMVRELAREGLILLARDNGMLREQGIDVPQIRIAMAVWQAIDSDLVHLFTAVLDEFDLDGNQFAIELMDGSNAVERDAIRPILGGLRALGVDIGFDNFMTGSTPLGGVIELNPSYVNLYAQGHAPADKGYNTRAIAESARMLSDQFGWELIAKDIDTPEMLAAIRDLPIRFGQGEAIAPGMSREELAEFLRSR